MEQLAFFEDIGDKEYKQIQKQVVKALSSYKALVVFMTNKTECERENVNPFPELRKADKIKEIKYVQINRALEFSLDPEQRKIIQLKYLRDGRISDKEVKAQMYIENNWYYYQKKSAILNIATALRMI